MIYFVIGAYFFLIVGPRYARVDWVCRVLILCPPALALSIKSFAEGLSILHSISQFFIVFIVSFIVSRIAIYFESRG